MQPDAFAAYMPAPSAADRRLISRRHFIRSLATVSAAALLAPQIVSPPADLVEVNGWILRRSDLA